jgi:RimJ/RimL family protein N-acetyltransferase
MLASAEQNVLVDLMRASPSPVVNERSAVRNRPASNRRAHDARDRRSFPNHLRPAKAFPARRPSRIMQRYAFTARDGKKVVFREPRSADARSLMDFINGFVGEGRSGLLIDKKTDIKAEKRWLKARMREIKGKQTVMLLVECEGRVVGNCDVKRRIWKESHRAVFGIALSEEVRGKGIGEALIRKTIALAKQRMRGLEAIDLAVIDYNRRAKGLYGKVGFVKVARMPRAIKEDREYFDEDWMVMRL